MTDQDDDQKKQQDQDEQKRKQVAQPIGKPIVPQQDQGEPSQPPNVQSVGAPIYPISSEETGAARPQPITKSTTPQQDTAAAMENQGQPQYHGIKRVLDTIANISPIGRAIEGAANVGSEGYRERLAGAEGASAEEQGREKAAEGQQESQAKVGTEQATAGEQTALANLHEAQSHMVTLHGPTGDVTMPQEDYDKLQIQQKKNEGGAETAKIKSDASQNAAQTAADARVISAAISAGKSGKPVQGTVEGKPAWGLYVHGSGWFDSQTNQPIPKFTPPPNWSEAVVPVQITGTQGEPEVGAFHRDTGNVTATGTTSGTGPTASKIQSAHTLERMIDNNVAPLVQKMTQSGEFGIIQGRFSDWLDSNIGDAPPDVAQFHQLMNGVVSTMQSMYGFRRQEAVAELDRQMGARMTPESLAGALKGIRQHADSIIGPTGGSAQQIIRLSRDANGKLVPSAPNQ